MLRITVRECEDHLLYILEGRLAGDWVQELVWITRELCPGTNAVIDIENVHYVDQLGEKSLHWLNRLGAAFVADNPYGVHLCERLNLRRMTMADNDVRQRAQKVTQPESTEFAGSNSPRRRSSRPKSQH